MALVAGPPRRDENKGRSSPWSDVGFAWCNQSPYTPVWRRSLIGTPNCSALEHEHQTLDRRGSSRRRPYFHISAWKENSEKLNFRFTEFSEVRGSEYLWPECTMNRSAGWHCRPRGEHEPSHPSPRHHDERRTPDHVGDHLRHRRKAAEAFSLLPSWRGERRHRGPHDHLHSSHPARQRHLAWRPLEQRIARQNHPVPARRSARIRVHQELRGPRDYRTPQVAGRPAKRHAQDGVHDRTAAALGVSFRPCHPGDGRGEPRAERRLPAWCRALYRGNDPYSGASGALLPAVSQARRAGHAEGTRLDEHPQLAGEHHRLRHIHLAYPLLKSEGRKGALQWRCTRRLMARGSTESISRSVRSSPPTERARPSPSTACRTGRWQQRW